MKNSLGRVLYGVAAICYGACAFAWHDISNVALRVPHRELLAYAGGTIELLAGIAVLLPRTTQGGALALGALYCIFALTGVPAIVKHPAVYNSFGNLFEQLALATGAAILCARAAPMGAWMTRLAQIGCCAFAVCLVSFALEQLFYLAATASLVPKWIPPGQMFWAIATTIAFGLAAIALLTGYMARLASRLATAMLIGFGLLVWVPALFADPHSFGNWSESAETFAIAASAWVVAEFLNRRNVEH